MLKSIFCGCYVREVYAFSGYLDYRKCCPHVLSANFTLESLVRLESFMLLLPSLNMLPTLPLYLKVPVFLNQQSSSDSSSLISSLCSCLLASPFPPSAQQAAPSLPPPLSLPPCSDLWSTILPLRSPGTSLLSSPPVQYFLGGFLQPSVHSQLEILHFLQEHSSPSLLFLRY